MVLCWVTEEAGAPDAAATAPDGCVTALGGSGTEPTTEAAAHSSVLPLDPPFIPPSIYRPLS